MTSSRRMTKVMLAITRMAITKYFTYVNSIMEYWHSPIHSQLERDDLKKGTLLIEKKYEGNCGRN
jgi:hypothetical protein